MAKQPSVITGIFKSPFLEQVAYFRNKLGNLVPTARWDDLEGAEHDVGFMVAGAQKADLLADLAAAVDRAITEGKSLHAFRKEFFSIVEKRGWHGWTGEGSAKGEAWRTRIIYQTNMRTSYAAGRRAQLIYAGFDIWVYKHGHSRSPRPQHLAWDGLALPANHPFWKKHYPPADNAYGCNCYAVGARSNKGAERLGADLSKALPNGWDNTLSAGYDLGARVTYTITVMAKKMREWPTEVRELYLQSLPDHLHKQF